MILGKICKIDFQWKINLPREKKQRVHAIEIQMVGTDRFYRYFVRNMIIKTAMHVKHKHKLVLINFKYHKSEFNYI